MISIIVPIRNETRDVVEGLRRLAGEPGSELLIADGGDDAETARALESLGARILRSSGTRGARLDEAARQARGDVLFFLHADSRPPEGALALIGEALAAGADAGAFSLAYQDPTPALRWIAFWANLRSRFLELPFGDQGLFCRKETYARSGGFPDLPICDDVDFVRRVKRVGVFRVRPEKVTTSPRRYRERGALRQVLRNWRVLLGYYAGVSPKTLHRWYDGRD